MTEQKQPQNGERIGRLENNHEELSEYVHSLAAEMQGLKQRSNIIVTFLGLLIVIGITIGKMQVDQTVEITRLSTNRDRDAADANRRDEAIKELTDAVNRLVKQGGGP